MRASSRARPRRASALAATTELAAPVSAGPSTPAPSPRAAAPPLPPPPPPLLTLSAATDAALALGVAPLALLMGGSALWPLGLLLGAQALLLGSSALRALPGGWLLALLLARAAAAGAAGALGGAAAGGAAAAAPVGLLPSDPAPAAALLALQLCFWGAWEGLARMGGVGSWGEAVIALEALCLGAAWAALEVAAFWAAPSASSTAGGGGGHASAAAHHQSLFAAAWALLGGACVLAVAVLLVALPCGGCGVRPRGAPAAARLAAAAERQDLLQRLGAGAGAPLRAPRLAAAAAQLLSSQWWAAKGTAAGGREASARVGAALRAPAHAASLFSFLGLLRAAMEEVVAGAGAGAAPGGLSAEPHAQPLAVLAGVEDALPALARAGPSALLLGACGALAAALLPALNALLRTDNCLLHVAVVVVWGCALHPAALALVGAWAGALAGALALLPSTAATAAATGLPRAGANLLLRKAYHALGVGILVPGIVLAPSLCALALGGAALALGALELARALRLRPHALHTALHAAFSRHTDERETTAFYTTHFYLLLGMGLPFLLAEAAEARAGGGAGGSSGSSSGSGSSQLRLLEALSGVLALGVGDAAAAVAGTLASHAWGKARCLPWADVAAACAGRPGRGASGVTVLGTAAFAASVVAAGWGVLAAVGGGGGGGGGGGAAAAAAAAWGGLTREAWGALLASAVVGAGVEAGTGAVDNAVVPIYAWAAVRGVRAWVGQ